MIKGNCPHFWRRGAWNASDPRCIPCRQKGQETVLARPSFVVSIGGENYVILRIDYDGLDRSKTLTLIDEGSFERKYKYYGKDL